MGLWVFMALRGAYLQILPNDRLGQLQKRQFATNIEVIGRRGLVVDRQGRELAASVAAHSLFADPMILERPKLVARRLATLLKIPRQELSLKLRANKKRFVWIKRQITEEQAKIIRRWDIRGLGLVEEARRVYPNQTLASDTLGSVGSEGQGLEGLELQYDKDLLGETKKVVLPRDARGRPLLPEGGVLTAANDGAKLELTLDSQLQFVLQKELASGVTQHAADGALGVVLDPHTGAILAMASEGYQGSVGRNRVISDAFEFGSVMKTFVIAAALRENQVRPNTKIDCEGGRMKVGDKWIREAEANHDFGVLTVSEILAFSSNVGTAKIAMSLGAAKLRQSLMDFGFGQKLEVDFPGEARGILQPLPWRSHLLSNIAFGHGLSVTPLQLASAYAAIANGGVLRRPYLVKKVARGDDEITTEPREVRRILSEEQASTMKLMLRAATMDHATGVKARIAGFPVAGKTGTAQKVDLEKGGYRAGSYIASFAGFVPAHAPKFVIFVAVDNPRKDYYAAQVAAPIFSRVAQYAVRQEGLAPVLLSEENVFRRDDNQKNRTLAQAQALRDLQKKRDDEVNLMPELGGLTLREVLQEFRGKNFVLDIRGHGVVASSNPKPGSALPEDRKIRVDLAPVE